MAEFEQQNNVFKYWVEGVEYIYERYKYTRNVVI